jgi:hypothetical protein
LGCCSFSSCVFACLVAMLPFFPPVIGVPISSLLPCILLSSAFVCPSTHVHRLPFSCRRLLHSDMSLAVGVSVEVPGAAEGATFSSITLQAAGLSSANAATLYGDSVLTKYLAACMLILSSPSPYGMCLGFLVLSVAALVGCCRAVPLVFFPFPPVIRCSGLIPDVATHCSRPFGRYIWFRN